MGAERKIAREVLQDTPYGGAISLLGVGTAFYAFSGQLIVSVPASLETAPSVVEYQQCIFRSGQ